jgi:hypothetical protein
MTAPTAETQWAPGALARRMMSDMARLTDARIGTAALANARANSRAAFEYGHSIAQLRGASFGKPKRAVIVAAGPSLHRTRSLERLVATKFDGIVIATDSAVLRCLRHGIVPDLVVTVDPHDDSIVRWFGDPALDSKALAADDYFRRQDMDDLFHDEERTNRELLRLMEQYGPQLSIAMSTSAGPRVVQRARECGMRIYWFNPMLDDPADPKGRSRELMRLNRLPCINCGGNVGSACWMIADAILEVDDVALLGIDFSYYDGTPHLNTQYYHEAIDLVGKERIDALFVRIFNPHVGAWFYTDPAYLWFREVFLEMARDASAAIWNCTDGGILFGEHIRCAPIEEFVHAGASRLTADHGAKHG